MVTGSADNGREDSSWRIVTGETSLAHTRAIVNDEGSNFFLHGYVWWDLEAQEPKKVERMAVETIDNRDAFL